MQSIKKALFVSVFFFAPNLTAAICPPPSIQETARVAYVHDGDTLKLVDGRKVRLLGIDAPEVAGKYKSAQPYAYQARDALRQLIKQGDFKVAMSFGIERQDKYQRTLAHLYLADGTNIQAELIMQGLAAAYATPPNDRQSDCYSQVEAQAIKSTQGVWSLPQYQVKAATQLQKEDRGFRRVQGKVMSVQLSKKALLITLQGNLRIRIASADLKHFDVYSLQQLKGKNIRVRGWVHPQNNGYFMSLRHPSSLIAVIK